MFRSLHMKLVLIMVLLIVSLMTVVGAFLISSVAGYYLNEFYTQMAGLFGEENRAFVLDLTTETQMELDGVQTGTESLREVLDGSMGVLGVDGRSRNYYILDGETGAFLGGSNPEAGANLEITPNLAFALASGEVGGESDITASYMDVAVPITRGDQRYIIYILDNRQQVQDLNSALFTLIVQALVFGLIISVLLSFLLAKTMITPIERLTGAAKRVASGDFSDKIEVGSRDEIGVLTNTFNNMARQLQETLRAVESERNKLDTLFLHMTDGVVACSGGGAVIHSNPAAERMLGSAIPVDGPVRYDDLFAETAALQDVLSVGQPGYLEGTVLREGRTLEVLLAPFHRKGQGGVLAVLHDVTEKEKTEQLRREFVANVSHELRTPLTNIRSYAETLAEDAEIPRATQEGFLGVILNESDRMTHIVQDLLALSRFDSGHSQFTLSTFSFERALRDCHAAILLEAQRHGHALDLDLAPGLPDITADRARIVQVMMNILANAVKYTPNGGHILLSAGHGGGRVWMEVADDGIGIPDADRERIFERFYRVDKARSRESGGTGLGLSIAKEIIELHEGVITLVDRPGPGLTVRVELLVGGPRHEQ